MDRRAFAEKVDALLIDKVLARNFGEAGRQFADERYNFDAYLDGLECLFARASKQTAEAQH